MHYLRPWFIALAQATPAFKIVMVDLGITFKDNQANKASVVKLINEFCAIQLIQSQVWQAVYDSRKTYGTDYDFLFPPDPELQRKRQWCHLYEAWYTVALLCAKHDCLHRWLRHFTLGDDYDLIKAKQIIFNGTVIVNGIHIQGAGLIQL